LIESTKKSIIKEKKSPCEKNLKTKIIAITSGKGGVGKSMIAANISFILANKGYKVGIFDGDIGLSNLDIIFNVRAKNNFLNVLKGEYTLDDIKIDIEENLILIPNESGDEILNFEPKMIQKTLLQDSLFLDKLDYLIIDTSSGIGEYTKTFLEFADEIIIVTIPNPLAITDAYTLIKITSDINENLNIIINMTENKEGKIIYEKIKKVAENNIETPFSLNYLGHIETSKNISKSIKFRQLFTKTSPSSLSSFHLSEIVDNIILQLENQAPPKKTKNSFKLFIKRVIDNF